MPTPAERQRLLCAALALFKSRPMSWIPGAELAAKLGLLGTRDLRSDVIWPLRCEFRIPIHSRPGTRGGYKLAVSDAEHKQCVEWNDQMGRDFMAIRAIVRNESLDVVAADAVRTLFPLRQVMSPGRQDALDMLITSEARAGRRVRFLDVLNNLFATLAEQPEQYAEEIADIRRRWGGLFLSADQRAAAAKHVQELSRLLAQP